MSTHIILKYKNPRIAGETVDTIAEHRQVLSQVGYVDFGILGKGVSVERASDLTDQKKKGLETYLFLVSSSTDGLKTFKCTFDEISKHPRQQLRHPEYYKSLGQMSSWIRIFSIQEVDNSVLKELVTISTERLALESLSKGMASTIFVREKETARL